MLVAQNVRRRKKEKKKTRRVVKSSISALLGHLRTSRPGAVLGHNSPKSRLGASRKREMPNPSVNSFQDAPAHREVSRLTASLRVSFVVAVLPHDWRRLTRLVSYS